MLSMNVFNQDAFSATSLSAAIDKLDYVPDYLGAIPNLFIPDPVRTTEIWIEDRTTGAVILPFSPRGTPPHQTSGDKRNARPFSTLRFSDASRIHASELFAIREFGSEVSLKTLMGEVSRRQFKMKRNFEVTKEYHRLNLITQAKVLDSDGSTKVDWAAQFGQTVPSAVTFTLTTYDQNGGIRKSCNAVRRSMLRALKGVGVVRDVIAICGDNFYDALISNKEVRETYQFAMKAQELQNGVGQVFDSFRYGNILWVNYRGSDPDDANSTAVGVNTDHAYFVPVGADIFRWALSPGESFAHLGQLGQDTYSRVVTDKDRDEWADIEAYSYPLPICTMPQALASAVKA